MIRRDFLKLAGVSAMAMAAQGNLPLLARKPRGVSYSGLYTEAFDSRFVSPNAIAPVNGYLPKFTPVGDGSMQRAFQANYTLVRQYGQTKELVSNNSDSGSLTLSFDGKQSRSEEVRHKRDEMDNTVKTVVNTRGPLHTAASWTLESSVVGVPEVHYTEQGRWDGQRMQVKGRSFSLERETSGPLIDRWSLLPLLASGKIKQQDLKFDLLDESTLRPNQTLRYMGEVTIPVASGETSLDCYVQSGWGIVPTHYLVDPQGRVQLITMATVNWALMDLS